MDKPAGVTVFLQAVVLPGLLSHETWTELDNKRWHCIRARALWTSPRCAMLCLLPRTGPGLRSPGLARAGGSGCILFLCMCSPVCAAQVVSGEELLPVRAGLCTQRGFSPAMQMDSLVTEKRDLTGSLHRPHMPKSPGSGFPLPAQGWQLPAAALPPLQQRLRLQCCRLNCK